MSDTSTSDTANKVTFELASPEALLVSTTADMVVVPGAEGDFGVLPGHAPFISEVRPGVIDVYQGDKIEERVFVAMLGGAAGTLASLGELGLATQEKMGERLGMGAMAVPARTIGDHQAEYVTILGLLAATCSKMGREVYTLMKQEFGEVEEPVPKGTVGSSTMPQKRNPRLSQDIVAGAAQLRALVPLALEAAQTEHEADRTTTVMMNRAVSNGCELTGDILQRLIVLFEGLQVFPERMRRNLDLSGGLIMAEAIMLELGAQIGRQRAHDAVYDASQASVIEGRPFRELLAEEKEVSTRLTAEQIEALLDPARYSGLCQKLAETGAARARRTALELEG